MGYVLILVGFLSLAGENAKPLLATDIYPSYDACQAALVENLNAAVNTGISAGVDTVGKCVAVKHATNQ